MTIGPLIGTVPWFVPGIVVTMALATLLCTRVGRWLDAGSVRAWWLIAALGSALVVTLTPQRDAVERGVIGSGACDLSRLWLAPLDFYLGPNDSAENILLFVPLGIAIAFLRGRTRRVAIAAGVLLPIVIELLQSQVTILNRSCESADVVDNLAGLLIGLAIGAAVTLSSTLIRAARRGRQTSVRARRGA
jgi:VanZ family protein